MSNRASQIIVLCEDKLHYVFVKRFLKKWGVSNHAIREEYQQGQGSGAANVIADFPKQLEAVRSRSHRAITILIVVIDADNKTVEERKGELEKALEDAGMPKVADDERICCVIPKWSMDTWLAYLQDGNASEDESYKNSLRFRNRESEAHPLIDMLAESCKAQGVLANAPPSLMNACSQFDKIRHALLGA